MPTIPLAGRTVAALALLSLAACDTAGPVATEPAVRAGGLRLDADRDRYGNRDTARLTLANTGGETYWTGILDCAIVERWDGSAWAVSRDGNGQACIAIAVEVAPGASLTASVPIRLPDGSYRFTQGLGSDDASVTVATAAFRVE